MSQFYALMSDNTVKHISLKEEIVTEIKNIFINGGAIFKPEGIEEDVFDGNIISRNGENITYVHYDLPEDFARIPYNQADMSEYNINEDMPKSIFYYDDGKFYFQVFNKRNMLQRKMVLQFECGNIFAKMNNSAFIVEDKILCQSRVTFSEIKVGIGHAIDNLCACRLHAWPSTIQVAYIAPHIEGKCIPGGFVLYIYDEAIMSRNLRS